MSSTSSESGRHEKEEAREETLSSDSSDIVDGMAELSSKLRQESSQTTGISPSTPLSMKLFASWEVESSSSSCVPRLFSVKLTRLQIVKKMDSNLSDVVISVSMQGSRRVLRSNEISLPPSGLIDTDVDLSFSLQYPHFLKRSRNNVQIMIQRRKRYKTRAILGFKTLAVGLVNLSEILQYPVSAKRPLHMHMKGHSTILATVTMTNLISQPVESDLDREIPQRNTDDRALEDNSSDEDDDSYSSDGSDSAGEMEEPVQDILGPATKGRKVKFRPNQIKFKKKFIALLKKFRVPEEEVFGNLEGSPQEAEGADDLADDVIYPEDLEEFDSDADSDVELGDNASIKSQDKPKLRPYFDRAASVDSMYVEKKSKFGKGDKKMAGFDSEESTEAEHSIQDVTSPHSDSERHSDSPATHSDTPLTQLQRLKDSNKTHRSLSVKEGKHKTKVKLERRKSDLEIQDVWPKSTISEQLSTCFSSEDGLPTSILMINTSEWQGQLLALKLKGKQSRIISTTSDNEVQDVIAAILVKYQKFSHSHSISPPCMKIAIAGTESYISDVLRSFVEQFSLKPLWQNYVRFLVIPLDSNHAVGKYISNIDSKYNSLFMDSVWRNIFEKPDSNADFETVNQRINTYVNGASVTHHLPIAEALINRRGSDDDSSRFIPFVGMVRIGCVELGETDDIVNGNSPLPGSSQITSGSLKESTQTSNNTSTSPPSESKPGASTNKDSSPQTPLACSELMDLQVDYWAAGGKKESNKSTLKTAFKSLVVSRHHNIEEPGTLQMIATTKEQNLRKVHAKSAFEAMMRGKKSKDRESETKGMIVANVTKLVCTSRSQSDSLSVVIDGVSWDDVKFFSLSPQWSRHVKTFPIGLIGPLESCF